MIFMIVCRYCLEAIESHEGKQWKREVENDDIEEILCEWCDEPTPVEECYEIKEEE